VTWEQLPLVPNCDHAWACFLLTAPMLDPLVQFPGELWRKVLDDASGTLFRQSYLLPTPFPFPYLLSLTAPPHQLLHRSVSSR
jgi:hypothetical protein